ncbi:MAG: o-succinylbenzoate--CoA ligase [Pseudanabaenaceae cyanobacterium bins.39]|nr:o-succinylbenzoate--CoA ligase [Pseudanabaenaceae cyanobacterium bins.39]
MFFPDWLSQQSVQNPYKIALSFYPTATQGQPPQAQNWTFAHLDWLSHQWAEQLQAWGISRGDRVAILATNQPHYLILIHALTKCEAIAVFLNIRLTATELSWQIQHSQTTYLCYDDFTASTATAIHHQLPNLNILNILKNLPLSQFPTASESIIQTSPTSFHRLNFQNLQGIFFTSGTTGKPKAVPLTYGNHFFSAIASTLKIGSNPDDNWLLCMPLFHVGGLAIAWRSLINGTQITLLPKFDVESVLNMILPSKISLISLVPTMLTRLLQHDQWHSLQSLRGILLGGDAIHPELLQICLERNLSIMPTYGMTEAASQITTLLTYELRAKQGSSGLPLLGMEVKIVSTTDDALDTAPDLPRGEVGQIVIRGENVMGGYLHHSKPQQGQWFATGDLGYSDRDGYLYVINRRTDLIISGGENIYPSEVEAILLQHPAIAECCVFGKEDKEWGAIVVAAIVLQKNDQSLSLDSVRTFCQQQGLSSYKLPKAIHICPSLSKSASGKILRQQVSLV